MTQTSVPMDTLVEGPLYNSDFVVEPGRTAKVEYAGFMVYTGVVYPVNFLGQHFIRVCWSDVSESDDGAEQLTLRSILLNPRFVYLFEHISAEEAEMTAEQVEWVKSAA